MSKEILKNKFKNGMIPDENDFGELIDFMEERKTLEDDLVTSQNLKERSVGLEHLGFAVKSSNMFNRGDVTTGKSINHSTGDLADNSSFNTSNFIRIEPNTDYHMYDVGRWGLYRSDFSFINSNTQQTVTTTGDSFFMRIAVSNTRLGSAQLNKGSLQPYDSFSVSLDVSEKTGLILEPSIATINNAAILPEAVDPSQTLFFKQPNNKFNKKNIEPSVRIDNENLVPDDLFVTTKQMIPAKPSTRYSVSGSSIVGFYDIYGRFISRFSPSSDKLYFDTPKDCYNLIFSVAKTLYETYMVNEGNLLLPYEEHKYKLVSTSQFPIEIPSGSEDGSVDTTLTYSDKIISEYSESYSGALSAGNTQLVAEINGSLLSKEIYMTTNDLNAELVIEVLMDGGTYKPYKLLASDGSGEVPITMENLTMHGSSEFLISAWDIIEKQYAFNLREKQFGNGIKVSVKNNGSTSVNVSVRVSGGKYA